MSLRCGAALAFAAASLAAPAASAQGAPGATIEGFEVVSLYGAAGAYGFVLGTAGGLASTDDSRNASRLLLPLAGLLGGEAAAFALHRAGSVRRGRGYAVSAGVILGGVAGGGVALYANPDDPAVGWGIGALTTTVGLGLSLGLAHVTDALPGTMNFVTTGGVWGAVLGGAVATLLEGEHVHRETMSSALLIGEGFGVVLAAFTANLLEPTPAQTRWVDLGALLGGLLGGSLALASQSAEGIAAGVGLGVLGGGVGGWFAGRPGDAVRRDYLERSAAREAPMRFGLAPLPGGAMLTLGM